VKAAAIATAVTLLGLAAIFASCGHGTPPDPNDPTAPPPSVMLPRDPLAPPFTPFYQRTDGGMKS
jgi:hypothetical protein